MSVVGSMGKYVAESKGKRHRWIMGKVNDQKQNYHIWLQQEQQGISAETHNTHI